VEPARKQREGIDLDRPIKGRVIALDLNRSATIIGSEAFESEEKLDDYAVAESREDRLAFARHRLVFVCVQAVARARKAAAPITT
jgi:hypothetical protein